ncbi:MULTISPECIES: sialate O-acetylesterase [Segatella]|jgi:sialate O-acetylesterase|nr:MULTISPECIES: sialate O-acetylesterase [Segatella]MDR4930262.1 sialate O-acetylesterase [Segatella bryantii]UKK74256.1 sialate O-acetylesterase [Segatella bryantii]UKK76412.1 sialate O-acetylesterase [Segatella bryantii]UKK78009.1 sialate O-acetylesterase [Segatella baroniae B14]SEP85541.1 sialate O-acetylesterase [Segatella baroniae B14]
MNSKKYMLSAMVLLASLAARAEVKLPRFFSDGMVLQQQSACNLWGTARAEKHLKVKTSWDGKTYTTTVGQDGKWQLQVNTPVAGGPYTITFDDGDKTQLQNILIGEVWICSGQSNMEMPMKGFKGQPVAGAIEEIMTGADANLHFFTVKRNPQLSPIDSVSGKWEEASSASIRQFSATAYFFGKALRKNLNVPVGLIVTAFGGSACEAWMAKDWLKKDFPTVTLPWSQEDVDKKQQRCPTALYNGMLRPLIGYTLKGAIWYQGEDNVNRAGNYADLFSTMIKGWRKDWNQGDFPFYYCQIAPYNYDLIQWDYNSAILREQQAMVEKMVPNSRMAVLMDAGLEYGIHPRKKREAGERLAVLALSNTYKVQGLPDFATYSHVEFNNDTAVVAFDRSKEWVYFQNGPSSDLFEVAGEDKVFYPAKTWTSRNRVYVKSDKVKKPVAVRYAFKNWVQGDLFHDGLPVSSFRTDTWEK